MVTQDLKIKVKLSIEDRLANFGASANKHAKSIGISGAIQSRLLKGETEKILSDGEWLRLARMLLVEVGNKKPWNIANTPVFQFINEQLKNCQANGVAGVLCDKADIGKTETAKHYARNNRHVVYVDCSQVKTKQKLVRYIAAEFGLDNTGKYAEVYADLVYYLQTLNTPLIILDEGGDLAYDAFLELKALWNATERSCGWYMMGADGLKQKIQRAVDNKKVGYAEFFSRYGSRYQKITPSGKEDAQRFFAAQAAMIAKANAPEGTNIRELIVKADNSLRRINIELTKNEESIERN